MDSRVPNRTVDRNDRRRSRFLPYFLGLTAVIIAIFTIHTNVHVSAQSNKSHSKDGVHSFAFPRSMRNLSTENAKKERTVKLENHRGQRELDPSAITAGTALNNVSFFGIDLTSSITAVADTNGDLVPDSTATENFIATADADNEATSSFVFSKKTGLFYTGAIAAGGPNKQKGFVLVSDNSAGNYKSTMKKRIEIGKGTPVGMAIIDSPQGDILIVASYFFGKNIIRDVLKDDAYTITAYLPGSDGIPDASKAVPILGAGSTLGNNPINFGFGGLAVDSKGNLYANAAIRVKNGTSANVDGLILVFTDTDGDLVPDSGDVFTAGDQSDLNPITASSIVAMPNPSGTGTRLAVYGVGLFQGQNTQVVFYDDADGDLVADGPAKVFYTATPSFDSNFGSFGDGSSGVEVSHMDFAGGQAFFSFIAANAAGDALIDSGVAMVKDGGGGVGGAATRIFQAPKTSSGAFGGITEVKGVPVVTDNVAPTVTVATPNGGEVINGGTQLQINFSSTDNTAVVSHDISLSMDGGATFPVVVASGLAGSVQTFSYAVPGSLDTTQARVRVIAKDAAGNMGMDTSDANFTIKKSNAADNQAPIVSITNPKPGDNLNAGTTITVNFTSSDNFGVMSHNIDFAADGVNFTAPLASGLSGTATSASVKLPSAGSATAAIRVQAVDAAGNVGTAIVGQLNVVSDTQAPTVTVTAPAAKAKLKGGQAFSVTFTSTDNTGVVSHDVLLSMDGGTNFTPLVTGQPGNVQSISVTIPNSKIKKGVIRVVAKDAAGNAGMGSSGIFKVKPSK